jgi:hypothetical protein
VSGPVDPHATTAAYIPRFHSCCLLDLCCPSCILNCRRGVCNTLKDTFFGKHQVFARSHENRPDNTIWRTFTEADLVACLEIQPGCIGDNLVGRSAVLRAWRRLFRCPAFLGMVVELERPVHRHKIVACGLGVFVSSRFADEEIANPRPGLNSRIIASIVSDQSVVLNYRELGLGNALNGLDFIGLSGVWRDGVLSLSELREIQTLLATSLVDALAGYRINRVLNEAVGALAVNFARSTGVWRVIAEFPDSALLKVTDREKALATPYSLVAALYRYNEPVMGFGKSDQELLLGALQGTTDPELASREALRERVCNQEALAFDFFTD